MESHEPHPDHPSPFPSLLTDQSPCLDLEDKKRLSIFFK